MNQEDIQNIRSEYLAASLSEKDANQDPIKQFEAWWQYAILSKIEEPNAMSIATCSASGKPSVRTVLLKGLRENGFIFFTNYESRKGKEIEENPFVALLFFWKELERQVRIEGKISKVSREKSEEYFHSRPIKSQLGALASHQSQTLKNRQELDNIYKKLELEYQDKEIPKPEYWGGYILKPESIEFWQGRRSRLHDRILFTRNNNNWDISRLSP